MTIHTQDTQELLINQLFEIAISEYEFNTDTGYNAVTIADITKNIIETALNVSTDYLAELNRLD